MANTSDQAGDRESDFMQLFASCQRQVHAYILALVFDLNVAADLLQESNIVLWQKFDQFQPGTNFAAWAREIARLAVLRHRQRSSSSIASVNPNILEQLAGDFSNTVHPLESERSDALEDCLSKLRDGDRELIMSRYTPGNTVSGLASRLERSENSVSQSLRRIRRVLLECTQRKLRSVS